MKKLLLPLSLIFGLSTQAQTTINESDLPAQGTNFTYYVLDSNATTYPNTTGNGVTWDYSALTGYNNTTKVAVTSDASTSSYSGDFPNAQDEIEYIDFATGFFSHDPDSLTSDGFVFSDPGSGQEVITTYDVDDSKLMDFPVSSSSADIDDYIEGEVFAMGSSFNITGRTNVTVQGSGTLNLGTSSYDNVLRIKTRDSVQGNTGFGTATIIRTRYEYRKPSVSNYPLFQITEISVSGPITINRTLVLSKDSSSDVSVDELNKNSLRVNLFPNPANDQLNITFAQPTSDAAQVEIFSTIGQKSKSAHFNNTGTTTQQVDISNLPKGIYFVRIQVGNDITTRKVSVL